jgi:hypothetical protein
MPAHAGTWISNGGRAHSLLTEELAKGLDFSVGKLARNEWLGNVLATADAYTEDDNANDTDDGGTADSTA